MTKGQIPLFESPEANLPVEVGPVNPLAIDPNAAVLGTTRLPLARRYHSGELTVPEQGQLDVEEPVRAWTPGAEAIAVGREGLDAIRAAAQAEVDAINRELEVENPLLWAALSSRRTLAAAREVARRERRSRGIL